MLGDIAGGHALRIQRDHRLVEPRDPALMLGHHHRRERARPVPRDLDREIADLGPHRLRRGSVPAVRRLLPDPIARVVAEVLGQLRFQRGLQDLPGQSRQQPVRASQFDPLTTSGGHELLRDRGDIRWRRKDLPGSQIDGLGLLSCCLQFSAHDVIHLPVRPKPNRSRRTPHTHKLSDRPRVDRGHHPRGDGDRLPRRHAACSTRRESRPCRIAAIRVDGASGCGGWGAPERDRREARRWEGRETRDTPGVPLGFARSRGTAYVC